MPDLKPIRFKILESAGLIQAFSTRNGGLSSKPYDSLNLGMHSGDDQQSVRANRKIFFDFLEINETQLVFPQQVHSANVAVVRFPGIVKQTDALITDTPGLFLTIQTADCYPVFVTDFQKKTCAIIHSGWRGTAQNITGKTLTLLQQKFDCSAKELFVAIGPGISYKNYQVDDNTAGYFDKAFLKADGIDHFKLDLAACIYQQIMDCGVPSQNIESGNACTFEDTHNYYSYRRDGKNSGRMMGVIGFRI